METGERLKGIKPGINTVFISYRKHPQIIVDFWVGSRVDSSKQDCGSQSGRKGVTGQLILTK